MAVDVLNCPLTIKQPWPIFSFRSHTSLYSALSGAFTKWTMYTYVYTHNTHVRWSVYLYMYIWWCQVHHQAHISRLYNFWHFHKHLSGIFRTMFQLWEAFFRGGRALGGGLMFSHCKEKLSNEISSTTLTQGDWGKRKEFKLSKLDFFNTVANALCWTPGTGEHKQRASSTGSGCNVYFWVQVRDVHRFLSSIQLERECKVCYMQESTKESSQTKLSSSKVKSKITNKKRLLSFFRKIILLKNKQKKPKKQNERNWKLPNRMQKQIVRAYF